MSRLIPACLLLALTACASEPEDPDDTACDEVVSYLDADEDGFGDPESATTSCEIPDDHVLDNTDCNDDRPRVNPEEVERCNGRDDDCNGAIDDEAEDARTFYADLDGDGFGDDEAPVLACEAPAEHIEEAGDCDDTNANVHPDGVELCNALDDDCNGTIDDDAEDAGLWYEDRDRDGFGNPDVEEQACSRPGGYAPRDGDCDDTTNEVNPATLEVCGNDVDEDCDGRAPGCGFSGTYTLSDAITHYTGDTDDRWPQYLESAGDIDGDGYDDIMTSVPLSSRGSGHSSYEVPGFGTMLYGDSKWSGGSIASEPTWGREAYTGCMDGIDGVGDLDGDGYDDVMAGATCTDRNGGEVFVLYGGSGRHSGTTRTVDMTEPVFTGGGPWERIGIHVVGAGDLDADGYDDAFFTGYGHVWLYYGSATRHVGSAFATTLPDFEAIDLRQGYGADISVGDLDGDGSDDVLLSQLDAYTTDGTALLYHGTGSRWSGTTGQLDYDVVYNGPGAGSFSLQHVMPGDVNGDGYDDIAIAAPYADISAAYASDGAVYVFHGGPVEGEAPDSFDTTDAAAVIEGVAGELLGYDLHAPGNVDGSGGDDLLVGTRATGALLYLGDSSLVGTLARADAEAEFGAGAPAGDIVGSRVTTGDFNGDGVIDLALAGPMAQSDAGRLWVFEGGL